jgi:hypothetical protein
MSPGAPAGFCVRGRNRGVSSVGRTVGRRLEAPSTAPGTLSTGAFRSTVVFHTPNDAALAAIKMPKPIAPVVSQSICPIFAPILGSLQPERHRAVPYSQAQANPQKLEPRFGLLFRCVGTTSATQIEKHHGLHRHLQLPTLPIY